MSFIDNSGDIVLDACLTDTGRARLAKGDGSFKITKFALGDDEIVYSQYNKNHASGSAYFDLNILQTPIFEAFTNNMSSMKSKLISIPRTNLLYLPVIKINDLSAANNKHSIGAFVVSADSSTDATFVTTTGVIGYLGNKGEIIRVDQGLDTTEISFANPLDASLVETQYIVEIDNRLGQIVGKNGTQARISYIDDDNIASYYLSLGTDVEFVSENGNIQDSNGEAIAGPRGTILEFRIKSSLEINTSTFLFEQIGSTGTLDGTAVSYIDATVTVNGATTGYQLEIPIRFVKL